MVSVAADPPAAGVTRACTSTVAVGVDGSVTVVRNVRSPGLIVTRAAALALPAGDPATTHPTPRPWSTPGGAWRGGGSAPPGECRRAGRWRPAPEWPH